MKQKESYVLERHKHKITQISTTGRWKTYYKDRNGKLKAIEKVNRDDLIKELYKLYSNYILLAVTTGKSFDYLETMREIPCCRQTYYDRYRRFFWFLDKER